jgi:predicted TPR repeat methyltransferase
MPDSQQPQLGIDKMISFFSQRPGELNVLDIGAGMGKWSKLLRQYCKSIEGVEVHKPYIDKFNLESLYDKLHNENIVTFELKNYDVAILGDVLEHIEYDQAIQLIENLKKNVKFIFLTIPITVCIQEGSVYGNSYETHVYQWSDKEVQEVLDLQLINVGANDNGLVAIGTYIWPKIYHWGPTGWGPSR